MSPNTETPTNTGTETGTGTDLGADNATSLRVSCVVNASPDRVFDAWTQPDQLRRWSCPEDANVEDAQVDLVVGGAFRIVMKGAGGKVHTAFGAYREIEPPNRLVYTWDWEEADSQMGETLVTIELNDRGGSTEVVITQEGFPNSEATRAHEQGWDSCLRRLGRLVG